MAEMRTRLDLFNPSKGLDRGRSKPVEMVWYLLKCAFFLSALPWPSSLKVALLRLFGAQMGEGVVIKPRVNVHFPWKLEVGDHVWLGEEVFILNFEPVRIGAQACISQRSFLCTGNHDYRDETFAYRNAPISIGAGAWIGAGVFVGPGVDVGDDAVVAAASVVTRNLPPNAVCAGNPAVQRGVRWKT
jgi:putative colanic acid biosynthesis acetyltransferase WcaF